MRLLALIKRPADLDAAVRVLADVTGLTLAEARMRLAPEPPALLSRVPEDVARQQVTALRQAGLAVLAIDDTAAQQVERTIVRDFALEPSGLEVSDRSGSGFETPWTELAVILRAVTTVRSTTDQTETKQKFDAGTALISGGLKMTRSVEQTTRTSSTETEQVVLAYTRDGRCAAFRELAVNYSCLGPLLQPVRLSNLLTIAKQLRERAPKAFYDERLIRLGTRPLPFVIGGESHLHTGKVSQTRTSTAAGVELLAEVIREALAQKLLP